MRFYILPSSFNNKQQKIDKENLFVCTYSHQEKLYKCTRNISMVLGTEGGLRCEKKKSNKICQGKLVDHTHEKVNNSLFLTEVKAASTKLSGNKFLFKIKI